LIIRVKLYDGIEKATEDESIHEPCWICGNSVSDGVILSEIDDGCIDDIICSDCIMAIHKRLNVVKAQ